MQRKKDLPLLYHVVICKGLRLVFGFAFDDVLQCRKSGSWASHILQLILFSVKIYNWGFKY